MVDTDNYVYVDQTQDFLVMTARKTLTGYKVIGKKWTSITIFISFVHFFFHYSNDIYAIV